jgi:hypothetical protein
MEGYWACTRVRLGSVAQSVVGYVGIEDGKSVGSLDKCSADVSREWRLGDPPPTAELRLSGL